MELPLYSRTKHKSCYFDSSDRPGIGRTVATSATEPRKCKAANRFRQGRPRGVRCFRYGV